MVTKLKGSAGDTPVALTKELAESKVELEQLLEEGAENTIYKAEALQDRITKLPILIRMAMARERKAKLGELTKVRARAKRQLDKVYPLYEDAMAQFADLMTKTLIVWATVERLSREVQDWRNQSHAAGYPCEFLPNMGSIIGWCGQKGICDTVGGLIEPREVPVCELPKEELTREQFRALSKVDLGAVKEEVQGPG